MRILFCINSIGRVSGIESVTILKANHLAELLKNNKWGGGSDMLFRQVQLP